MLAAHEVGNNIRLREFHRLAQFPHLGFKGLHCHCGSASASLGHWQYTRCTRWCTPPTVPRGLAGASLRAPAAAQAGPQAARATTAGPLGGGPLPGVTESPDTVSFPGDIPPFSPSPPPLVLLFFPPSFLVLFFFDPRFLFFLFFFFRFFSLGQRCPGPRGNDLPDVGVKSFKRACVCVYTTATGSGSGASDSEQPEGEGLGEAPGLARRGSRVASRTRTTNFIWGVGWCCEPRQRPRCSARRPSAADGAADGHPLRPLLLRAMAPLLGGATGNFQLFNLGFKNPGQSFGQQNPGERKPQALARPQEKFRSGDKKVRFVGVPTHLAISPSFSQTESGCRKACQTEQRASRS